MLTLSLTASHNARRAPSVLARLRSTYEVARQRKTLANLSDTQLADIGLTREQAQFEAGRPVWDAPQHWMK